MNLSFPSVEIVEDIDGLEKPSGLDDITLSAAGYGIIKPTFCETWPWAIAAQMVNE